MSQAILPRGDKNQPRAEESNICMYFMSRCHIVCVFRRPFTKVSNDRNVLKFQWKSQVPKEITDTDWLTPLSPSRCANEFTHLLL